MVYRSKDVNTKVYIKNNQLYETAVYDSPFYLRSPGNLWNSMSIPSDCSGQVVEVQIYAAYDINSLTFDHVYLGDEHDIYLSFEKSKLVAIVISLLVILIGLSLIFLDLMPYYRKSAKDHQSLYLGLYAFLMGLWSLLETNVFQLYLEDPRIVQLLDNMAMIMDNLPLLFFLDCQYHIFRKRFVKLICILQAMYVFVCMAIQFSGSMDLHDVLKGSWFFSFANDVILIWCAGIFLWEFYKTKKLDSQMALQMFGILVLIGTALYSLTQYTVTDDMDRADKLRIGLLFFMVSFSISSQLQMYRLLTQGLKYDFVRELAYKDGLTGLRNRTAYLEQLERIEGQDGQSLGVVFFDVNNLKQINDRLGHDLGDRMICDAADVISKSFGKQGKGYRIGGDEFCVLMVGDDLQQRYQTCEQLFYQEIQKKNQGRNKPYTLQIAHGFSQCMATNTASINKTIAEADGYMYSDKARLKEQIGMS